MVFEGFISLAFIRICIAVYTAVGAGVIRADIGALCAAALVPCRLMFKR